MKSAFYPVDWPIIAREVKEANGYICQECDCQCRRPGEMWIGWEYELTVSHYFHDYDSAEVFCAALCAPCHFAHDAKFSGQARLRWRRLRQQLAGQLALIA